MTGNHSCRRRPSYPVTASPSYQGLRQRNRSKGASASVKMTMKSLTSSGAERKATNTAEASGACHPCAAELRGCRAQVRRGQASSMGPRICQNCVPSCWLVLDLKHPSPFGLHLGQPHGVQPRGRLQLLLGLPPSSKESTPPNGPTSTLSSNPILSQSLPSPTGNRDCLRLSRYR
ncbi:hypothetical protein OH77DRAFT_1015680 [Trametes cingulata]|nr:hypothetical protein OH77DRAFT_1015680 [Trametes cingulata]